MSGAELVELRGALGLTQEDLSILMGVDERTVVRWESGSDPVPGMVDLLEALGAYSDLADQKKPYSKLRRVLRTHGRLQTWRVVLCAVLP